MARLLVMAVILAALGSGGSAEVIDETHSALAAQVAQIQRADYEGNRAELKRLYMELGPHSGEIRIESRVRYWRGFALWRRAINGFNETADPKELQEDLILALIEFDQAAAADPGFVDAKIAAGSCLSNLMFLNRTNPERLQELIARARSVLKEAEAEAPDNPRLDWVLGPNIWYAAKDESGQLKAIEIYEKGLAAIAIRKRAGVSNDPLQPSWGEPELLMNLAWSNLNRKTPDLKAAQSCAESALNLVPYWHYVRDILLPQIRNAMEVAEIQKLHEKDVAASKSRDFETLKTLLTDDAVMMPPGAGFVRGRAEREAMLSRTRDAMSLYEVLEYREDFEEVKVFGKEAVEWGTISGKIRDTKTGAINPLAYKVMRMLSKQADGEWKISRSIFNDMPLAPE